MDCGAIEHFVAWPRNWSRSSCLYAKEMMPEDWSPPILHQQVGLLEIRRLSLLRQPASLLSQTEETSGRGVLPRFRQTYLAPQTGDGGRDEWSVTRGVTLNEVPRAMAAMAASPQRLGV